MSFRTLSAAFFGSYPITYNLTCGVVEILHAYCEHSFQDVAAFNSLRDPSSMALKKFYSPDEMVDVVSRWSDIDVLIVAGFSYCLPMDVIRRFKWVINMYPGDLHTNRGATPLATDILQQNPFFSSSIHLIDSERLCSGPFISSARFSARYDQTYQANQNRVDNMGGLLLVEALGRLSGNVDLGAVFCTPMPGSYQHKVSSDVVRQMINARTLNDFLSENQSLLLQPA